MGIQQNIFMAGKNDQFSVYGVDLNSLIFAASPLNSQIFHAQHFINNFPIYICN